MSRSLPKLERLREWLITNPRMSSSLKMNFIQDYYHSDLSDEELFHYYNNVIISILY